MKNSKVSPKVADSIELSERSRTGQTIKNTKPQRTSRFLVSVAAVIVVVLVIVIGFILYSDRHSGKLNKNKSGHPRWHDKTTCAKVNHCTANGYSKPPLVIVSFDGFRRNYVDEAGWVKWLKKVGECGVQAEKVFPVYPSKTFVNHYSIVTGMYSASHGIVDNIFWDKELSPSGTESMGRTKEKKYWVGEPLWSIYSRLTGGKSNCYIWIGAIFDNHGHPCSTVVPFNSIIPFQERWDTVNDWLLLPESERPGLILLYFEEPDGVAHKYTYPEDRKEYQEGRKAIGEKVKEMDETVDRFLQRLTDNGIINCVNIAFVSDHGMSGIKEKVTIDDLIKPRLHEVGGPLGRIYAEKSVVADFLRNNTKNCKKRNKHYLVSTDETRPLRFHHTSNTRIGDLLIEGRPGVLITNSDYDPVGQHGYDYLSKNMQTVFFARGPSFKPGTLLPPFQNVEYLNLWLDLLEISPYDVKSNGTVGTLDEALKNPPKRREPSVLPMKKCPSSSLSEVCCPAPSAECSQPPTHMFSSNTSCYETVESFCGKAVLIINGLPRGVIEVMEGRMNSTCKDKNRTCRRSKNSFSLAADQSVDILALRNSFPGKFIKEVSSALDNLVRLLLKKYGRVVVLSGTAVDRDRNGLADSDQSQPPSLFFRLFLFCRDSRWSPDGLSCVSPGQLDSRSFAFPIVESDPNCLKGVELLLYYSCRLKDIELVAGIEVIDGKMNITQSARLRTKINEDLI